MVERQIEGKRWIINSAGWEGPAMTLLGLAGLGLLSQGEGRPDGR